MTDSEHSTDDTERGTPEIENLICDCKRSGQIMEKHRHGEYKCPNCGQVAELTLRYGEAVERTLHTDTEQ